MQVINYEMFGSWRSGRVITEIGNLVVVKSRNPYGSHNLVLVDRDTNEAFRCGNGATLSWVASERNTDRKLKKAIRRTIASVGYNLLANRPVSRLQQLVASNHTRYLAKLEAERLASRAGRE